MLYGVSFHCLPVQKKTIHTTGRGPPLEEVHYWKRSTSGRGPPLEEVHHWKRSTTGRGPPLRFRIFLPRINISDSWCHESPPITDLKASVSSAPFYQVHTHTTRTVLKGFKPSNATLQLNGIQIPASTKTKRRHFVKCRQQEEIAKKS